MSMEINGVVGGTLNLEAGTEVAQLTPRTAHSELVGRNEPGQHSIGAIDGLAEALVSPAVNLLVNADFEAGIVNQRNHSGAVNNAYCYDMWIGNGTVIDTAKTVDGKSGYGVELNKNSSLAQVLQIPPELLVGKVLTFSAGVLGYEGELLESLVVPEAGKDLVTQITNGYRRVIFEVEISHVPKTAVIAGRTCPSFIMFKITSTINSNLVRRLFLELGKSSHMEQTPPAEYDKTLLRCYRNLIRYGGTVLSYPCFAIAQGATQATMILNLPTAMRTDNSNVSAAIEGNPVLRLGSTDVAEISEFTQVRNVGGNALHATFNVAGGTLTPGTVYIVRLTTGAYLTFSTEIMP